MDFHLQVCDVFLVSEENMIIINTASGLVKLQLCGRDVTSVASPRSKAPVDFKDIGIGSIIYGTI